MPRTATHFPGTGATHQATARRPLLQRPESTTRGTHDVAAQLVLADHNCCRVLDIPCGYGALVERFAAHGLDAHGADLRPTIARPGPHFRLADMDRPLPYDDEEFDAVTSIDGIEHIERQFDFVRECHRVLRRGGSLVISTPNISSLRSRFRWLMTGFHNKAKSPLDEADPQPGHHRQMVAMHELRYKLYTAGFRITAIRTNRVKLVSWLFLPLVPLVGLLTRLAFHREETGLAERRRNREILRQMTSVAVLFGETLIVKARKVDANDTDSLVRGLRRGELGHERP